MKRTPSLEVISTRQRRIAELAKVAPGMAFTTLAHNIDIAWLCEAYERTRKDGAVGVDGQAAADYEANVFPPQSAGRDRKTNGVSEASEGRWARRIGSREREVAANLHSVVRF